MRKSFKIKFLTFFLALTLIFSCFPVSAHNLSDSYSSSSDSGSETSSASVAVKSNDLLAQANANDVTVRETENGLKIHFLNVGDASCVLLENDGKFAMVDCGRMSNDPSLSSTYHIALYLSSVGAYELEFLVLTNIKVANMGSIDNILYSTRIKTIYLKEFSPDYVKSYSEDDYYGYLSLLASIDLFDHQTAIKQDFNSLPKSKNNLPMLTLGEGETAATIELLNTETMYADTDGQRSLLALVSQNNHYSLLMGGYESSVLRNSNGTAVSSDDYLSSLIESICGTDNLGLLQLPNSGIVQHSSNSDPIAPNFEYFHNRLRPKTTMQCGSFSNLSSDLLESLFFNNSILFTTEISDKSTIFSHNTNTFRPINDEYIYFSPLTNSWYAMRNESTVHSTFFDYYFNFTPATFYFDRFGSSPERGFFSVNNETYYANSFGIISKNMTQIGDDHYYFDPNTGELQYGFINVNTNTYYANSSGIIQKNFATIDSHTYYFSPTAKDGAMVGAMQKGWQLIDNKWYYFDSDGHRLTGACNIDGVHYYLDNNGAMMTGFVNVNGNWSYYNSDGARQTGLLTINGNRYMFNESGYMVYGWTKIANNWHYFTSSGAMATGWFMDNSYYYYADGNGVLQTGFLNQGGKTYYLNPENNGSLGRMTIGWISIDNSWYLFDYDGSMVCGWARVDDKTYYFNNEGKMQVGWQYIGGDHYYFDASGVMQTGLTTLDGKQYMLSGDGSMETGWTNVNGSRKYFNPDGSLQIGWIEVNGKRYHTDENGNLLKGLYLVDGVASLFDSDGVLICQGEQVLSAAQIYD